MKERLSMKEILKQLVNYVLVLAMLCSLLPIMGTKVYAESTNTMSVEKFTGNTIVRKGTKVVPRENHKLTVYSFPARGSYIEVKCDSWIADDDYMVVDKWRNSSTYDDYIELEGKLVTITYDSNGGSAIEPTTDVIAIPEELPIPIKEGYTFGGWYWSDTFLGAKVSSGQKIYRDVTLYAKWIKNLSEAPVKDYTITALASGGGSISPSGSIKVTEGQKQTFTITPMEGYEIDTVKVDGIAVTASSSYTFTDVKENHSIKVTFKKQLRKINPYDLKVGDKIFKGDILDENKMIVICRTCHQIWILNAGEEEYGVGDSKCSQVKSLPEHSGHDVGYSDFNWYSTSEDSIAFKRGVPYTVVENECVRCKIIYDTNGGSKIEDVVEQVKLPKEFPIPTKPGYVFDGWYMDRYFTTAATPEMKLVKDTTLYAKWTEGHIHANHLTKVEAKKATCIAEGNTEYYVCECGKWFSDELATTETSEAAVKIEKKAHKYETEYTKDAKYHWKKCKNCDAVTEKQEHTSSGEATEENAETCTVCGYVIHEKLQKESNDSSMQWQTLNKAKLVTEKAFADYKAGKESNKSDIANVVAQALKENSLSNVAYEIISYEKTEPTSATEGKISGIVSLAIGGCSTQIPFDYVITKVAEPQKPAQITGKGAQTTDGQIKISWIKADGADGYRIYASVCDGESNYKLIKDTKDLTGAIKNLNNKKSYKFYVVAYKNVDGKKVRICKSMIYHVVLSDSKYTNVKAIKVAKTSYTLNVGDKQKLNAKSVKQEKNKKLLIHAQEFRYSSSDTTVATVSKTGEITAKQSGSCIIYVVANNGVMKKIKVNVA